MLRSSAAVLLKGKDMIFKGLSRTFCTENERQYETIGAFWNELSQRYGIDNLRGLGFNWTDNTIEYIIGLKDGDIAADTAGVLKEIQLPDDSWQVYCGKTEQLSEMYDEIYQKGALTYEIEEFDDEGNCRIFIWAPQKPV